MIQFDVAAFKGPKFSLQDLSFDNRLTAPIGKIVPVAYWELFPNEQIDVKLQQLTRFMPMPAPIMQRYDISFDAHFVPYRLLKFNNFNSEKFFNMSENPPTDSGVLNYNPPLTTNVDGAKIIANTRPGTLSDYLGIPCSLGKIRYQTDILLRETVFAQCGTDAETYLPELVWNKKFPVIDIDAVISHGDETVWSDIKSDNFAYDIGSGNVDVELMSFPGWLLQQNLHLWEPIVEKYGGSEQLISWQAVFTAEKFAIDATDSDAWTRLPSEESQFWKVFEQCTGKSFVTWQQEYFNYVITEVAYALINPSDAQGSPADFYLDVLPFWVYHRIVGDWYINTNFEDPDQYFADHIKLVYDSAAFTDLAERYWGQDYFTSCFTTPQVGNAVRIPANGTIADLRSANTLQKALERALYAGKRYIEQIFAFFGARSSDARLDRTEVLARKVFRMNINDVTQVNQADYDAMLDTPVGNVSSNGLSVGGDHFFRYKAEEHGMIMVLMSIRPKSSYFQGFNRIFLKKTPEDFLIPQYSNLGEQETYSSELMFDVDFYARHGLGAPCDGTIFGFNRRYAEYVYHRSEVHGEMVDSLDYWHAARKFDELPTLNSSFLHITDADDVNRVFNVPQEPGNCVAWLYFDVKCARALPRYINYEL